MMKKYDEKDCETLRGFITELPASLTDEKVEGILEELDEDGSG